MDSVQDTSLVERALRMAYTLRGEVADGLVFHADRGSQFTSDQIWSDSDRVYGAPRITAELAERYGIALNRKTVAKRMRLMGIEGISPRAFVPVTTIQSKRKSTLPDLVRRMFDAGELNRVWMSDITYLRTGEGWLYLCVIRDGHSRRVLGWAMDSVQDTSLVERALRMAYTLRGEVADGLVFHADRGLLRPAIW